MKINISSIKKERGQSKGFSFRLPVGDLIAGDLVTPFQGEVAIEGKISNVGDVLLLEALLKAFYKNECARCLEPLEEELEISLVEKFFPPAAQNIDEEALVYEGDFIDIKSLVSDSLLLEQPIRVLCKDDCHGLCPVCGKNLNLEDCACEQNIIDPRLAVLQRFGEGE